MPSHRPPVAIVSRSAHKNTPRKKFLDTALEDAYYKNIPKQTRDVACKNVNSIVTTSGNKEILEAIVCSIESIYYEAMSCNTGL